MSLLDFLYPKHCPVCYSVLPPGKKLICAPCREQIERVGDAYCLKCGRPLSTDLAEFCRNCQRRRPAFTRGIIWGNYASEPIRNMLSRVKYHGDVELLDFPCRDFAESHREIVKSWDVEALIPVPVHKKRLRVRGYNQAAEIATRLGEVWDIPVDTRYLIRSGRTAPQKELGEAERRRNLENVFMLSEHHRTYRRVLLVDDIYTTGSTADSCTSAIRKEENTEVYFCALAAGREV